MGVIAALFVMFWVALYVSWGVNAYRRRPLKKSMKNILGEKVTLRVYVDTIKIVGEKEIVYKSKVVGNAKDLTETSPEIEDKNKIFYWVAIIEKRLWKKLAERSSQRTAAEIKDRLKENGFK